MTKLIKNEDIGDVAGGVKRSAYHIGFKNEEEKKIFDDFLQNDPKAKKLEREAFTWTQWNPECGEYALKGEGYSLTKFIYNGGTYTAFKDYCQNNGININFED